MCYLTDKPQIIIKDPVEEFRELYWREWAEKFYWLWTRPDLDEATSLDDIDF